MFTECYESSTRADMRREAVPDSRSSNAKGTGPVHYRIVENTTYYSVVFYRIFSEG